jgi:hypothetical protein
MKQDYEFVIENLNKNIHELRETDSLRQNELDQAREALQNKDKLYDELSREHDELKVKYEELKSGLNSDFEHQLKKCEIDFMEKMTKMDEKLNEARREQAKAVVLMRQMERSTTREKERIENLLKSCDSYYQEHIKKLQAKLISIEKEKNMMANLLRQQNLSVDTNFASQLNYKYSPGAVLKSPSTQPLDFFSQYHENSNSLNYDRNSMSSIENMVEKNVSMVNENYSIQKKSLDNAGNETSFWLNNSNSSVKNDESNNNLLKEFTSQNLDSNQSLNYNNNSNYTNMSTSDLMNQTNNSDIKKIEILQHIRKIMGDLQLSDAEDENENNSKSNLLIFIFFYKS